MKVAAYVKSDAPKFPRSCFALEIDSATVLLDFSVSFFFTLFFSSFRSLPLPLSLYVPASCLHFAKITTAKPQCSTVFNL